MDILLRRREEGEQWLNGTDAACVILLLLIKNDIDPHSDKNSPKFGSSFHCRWHQSLEVVRVFSAAVNYEIRWYAALVCGKMYRESVEELEKRTGHAGAPYATAWE